MSLFIWGLIIIFAGGLASLISGRRSGLACVFGAIGAVAGSIAAVIPAFKVLLHGITESFRLNWSIPFGSFFIQIDPLSSVFLIPILCLSAIAAIYGVGYLWARRGKKNLGIAWFFYDLLLLGMVLVVVAKNGILFLLAWEIMSLAPFFLIIFDDEKEKARDAGWTYLVAAHIGMAFLLIFFLILAGQNSSMDFDKIGVIDGGIASFLFVLAVVGFGTKAGFIPLHVWLPEAHPAAPSHASAVMSGVMIKTGIYGLVRAMTFLGHPPVWWAWILIGIGASSGVIGVLFALAQHDLKRLLAYHSVENIGIITLGLGIGVLGISTGSPILAVFGFAGCFFHIINHALFKGLLFLGAGAVLHSSGTLEIDHLGGLIKRMPWTALTFLTGAVAISGLPPLNGFASEFLIYLGVFKDGMSHGLVNIIPVLGVIGGLALIGGLAAACFTKAFGIVFLGQPRSKHSQHAHEVNIAMLLPMATLAIVCVLMGVFSPFIIRVFDTAISNVTLLPQEVIQNQLNAGSSILSNVVIVSVLLAALICGFALLRKWLLSGRRVEQIETWGCGYVRPTARMQYTASSFAQPLVDLFRLFLRTDSRNVPPKGIFPDRAFLQTDTADTSNKYLYQPLFKWIGLMLSKLQWVQHGRLQLYVLYIALTLLMLLIWKAL
jgi:hydrogenase-4 component B